MIKISDKYQDRKFVILAFIISVGIIFVIRLIFLQLVYSEYKDLANNNALRNIPIHPPRGLIYDRNGKIVVYYEDFYDLMVVPNQVKSLDTLEMANLIGTDVQGVRERLKKAINYARYKESIFEKLISKDRAAYIKEKLYRYPGFYFTKRTLRKYPKPVGAHLLGYVGEVNDKHMEADSFYRSGDYIGISGIEKTYEKYLRGTKGYKKMMVDNLNREKGSFYNGEYDIEAISGSNLYTGLDIDVQEYGEQLMAGKKGGVVAIDPSTGEIIALISSPNYDPNLLVGQIRSKNYSILAQDSAKPLLNRALNSANPPGSTFKLVNSLIAMQEGVANEQTRYSCNLGWHYGGLSVGCHPHPSPLNMEESIQHSCNAYYCNVFRSIIENPKYNKSEIGYNKWREYVISMGFGQKFPVDLPYERAGLIPESKYYDKYYSRGHWNAITIISLSIGQGEILTTPLQLANLAALIGNRGFYFIPHLVRKIADNDTANARYRVKHVVPIDRKYFDIVANGMEKVTIAGTAKVAQIDSISVCGKTGTAQNPHGKNHSVFIAFAPKDNPKIAIAVFVENSGYGGTWAAPIASLMMEKYLTGKVSEKRKDLEKRMIEGKVE